MKKSLRGIKQGLSQSELERIAQQASPETVHNVQEMVAQYQGKSEGELLQELQRITGVQRAAGQLDDARIQQVAAMLAPMLTPEQQQKMSQILNGI